MGVGNPHNGRGSDLSHVTIKYVTKADPCFSSFLTTILMDFDETKCETDCNNYANSSVQ